MTLKTRLKQIAAHPDFRAVLILAGLWVFFFWQLLTPVQQDRVIFDKGDFPLHFYGFIHYESDRLWDGQIPLWNPYNYGGDPFAANVQMALFYPPRWITILAAGPDGFSIEALQMEVAAHYGLAALLMYAFLRVLVKQPFAALVGSVLWAFGGYLTGYPMLQPSIVETICWLPLLLLGVHLSLTRRRWTVRGILLGAGSLGLAVCGGHTQTALHITYLAGFYLLIVGRMKGLSWTGIIWRGVLLFGAGYALSAVQFLPAFEFSRLSYRAEDYHYFEKSLGFKFSELIQVFWPRVSSPLWWPLYVGVGGLLLAVGAMLRPRVRDHWFWIGAAGIGLWLTFGGYSVIYDLFYLLGPGVNTFRQQERAASLVAFALVVLAAYQLAWMLGQRDTLGQREALGQHEISPDLRRLRLIALGHLIISALAFLAVIVADLVGGNAITDVVPDTLGFVVLISVLVNLWLAWWSQDHRPIVSAALLGIIVIDLFTLGMNSPNFVPDRPENRIQEPDNLDLLSVPVDEIAWHVDGAAGIQTYGTYWRIPDIYGTIPISLASMEKIRQIRVDRRWEVLAVRYATMRAEVPDNVPVELIGEGVNYDGQKYRLYELTDPRPFAHLVYEARIAKNDDEARTIMKENTINLRETVVVTGSLPVELPGERPADASVRAFKMVQPEYMEMAVTTSEPALLTLPVANYPGWRVTVNGESVKPVDTYAGLIGIPIQPGANQKVTVQFMPVSVIAGGIISLLALIGIAGTAIVITVRERRTVPEQMPERVENAS